MYKARDPIPLAAVMMAVPERGRVRVTLRLRRRALSRIRIRADCTLTGVNA